MRNILILIINCAIIFKTSRCEINRLKFPRGFKFGAATSSYQIEGARDISGESNWDRWTRTCPECIADHSNGDIAADSYHKYKEDVALIKNIGLDYYRFSISWSRVLPTGFANNVNQEGLQYYRNLTNELLANGIEPVVTLHHFEHPQILEDMGGWTNALMVEWFVDYANVIFKEFGPFVGIFLTINEPNIICLGYESQSISPGKKLLDVGFYQCIHNMLKAHARVYHLYDKKYRYYRNGQIGLPHPCPGFVLDDSNDTVSAETAFQFACGMVTHAIYRGDYPEIVKKRVALVSKAQGYRKSRLPKFSPEWISYIKGTSDFFGLNHYTSSIALPDPDEARGIHNSDSGIINYVNSSWPRGKSDRFFVVPEGFRNLLRKIKNDFGNPIVYIFENGYPDDGEIMDYKRISYIHDYLKELILAIKEDGCRIMRYTVWSLLDAFEWYAGYTNRYGLIKVDFKSSNRDRTPKLSASWYKEVIRTHQIQNVPVCDATKAYLIRRNLELV